MMMTTTTMMMMMTAHMILIIIIISSTTTNSITITSTIMAMLMTKAMTMMIAPRTPHATRRTSHITPRTPRFARHTDALHVARRTPRAIAALSDEALRADRHGLKRPGSRKAHIKAGRQQDDSLRNRTRRACEGVDQGRAQLRITAQHERPCSTSFDVMQNCWQPVCGLDQIAKIDASTRGLCSR
jgi:hypothetical protein